MGIFKKTLRMIFKKNNGSEKKHNNTLEEDIHLASDWVVKALNSSGYKADYSLESMKEIDRFFDEQSSETGLLSKNFIWFSFIYWRFSYQIIWWRMEY